MANEIINLTIDGVPVTARAGMTVLHAARSVGIHIPTLCYVTGLNEIGACRICVVDTGARQLQAACVLPVAEGMVVKTNTPAVREARKINLELLLSGHDKRCLSCVRSTNCELQRLCREYGVEDEFRFAGKVNQYPVDDSSPSIVRDPNKCILCRRCSAVCHKVQNVGVIGPTGRGFDTIVESAWNTNLGDVACTNCGQCVAACPVGALHEKDDTERVWAALADESKFVVVQPAPAVRAALGEEFGLPIGTVVTGKLATALRRLGFDRVFDTNYGADLTIMEEAHELVNRIKNGGPLPMITSCSPAWIKFVEHMYPQFLPNLSTCKSPHQMLGATIKSYFAKVNGIDPKDIFNVSVMPCTAKKFESQRPEMRVNGHADVDAVITTRELARMLKQAGISFNHLPDGEFDPMLGESSGAGVIFGATGGVMEAALRTAYDVLTGEELGDVDFAQVRGVADIKEATIKLGDVDINVAVASGTASAAKLLEAVERGEKHYHFIEIMACPGGCVNGGGQPIVSPEARMARDPRKLRAQALYNEDKGKPVRKAHANPSIQKLYKEYMGEPNGELAHELLHTHFQARPKY